MKLSKEETRMYILDFALIALIGVTLLLSAWRLSEREGETLISIFGLPLPRMSMPEFVYLATVIFFLAVFVMLLVAGMFSGLHKRGFWVLRFLAPVLGLVIWVSFVISWLGGFGDLADDVAGGGNQPRWLVYVLLYSGFVGFVVYGFFWSTLRMRAAWAGQHRSDSSEITEEPRMKGGIATTLLVVGAALIVAHVLRRRRSP